MNLALNLLSTSVNSMITPSEPAITIIMPLDIYALRSREPLVALEMVSIRRRWVTPVRFLGSFKPPVF